jgi:hypothetical protein
MIPLTLRVHSETGSQHVYGLLGFDRNRLGHDLIYPVGVVNFVNLDIPLDHAADQFLAEEVTLQVGEIASKGKHL